MSTSPTNHPCRDPFADALDAVLSGEAGERERVILNETLRIDPEARRSYVQAMLFEGMLAAEFAPVRESAVPRPGRSRWWFPAVAAAIALGMFSAWMISGDSPPAGSASSLADDEPSEITHAVISRVDEAKGRFGRGGLATGLRLTDGVLELDSGLAEVTFDSGAEVTLEGPATLLLESGNRTRLNAGFAAAVVPAQACGFVIHTPTSFIRDLGSPYSVEVRSGSETDLHVLDGEVEVFPTARREMKKPRILRKREAVRLSGGDMRAISFNPDKRPKHTPKNPIRVPESVHWSFDAWDGAVTSSAGSGHRLELRNHGQAATPGLVEGPFGPALHLGGDAWSGLSDYWGGGESNARTVACWLRVQPDSSGVSTASNGIIGWGESRAKGRWQLGWNQAAAQGTVGAARVDFGAGHVVGSTDLRDGSWHHLALVFLGGPKANVATHVRIYVDGRLESLSGRRPQRVVGSPRASGTQPLVIGRYPGARKGRLPSSFEGDLDELQVFEGALLPKQIVRLMKRNTPRADAN